MSMLEVEKTAESLSFGKLLQLFKFVFKLFNFSS